MNTQRNKINKELDQLAREIQALFQGRGYQYAPISRFEEYDLYVENKNFLASEHIISFMDMDGKLLALKPDITISIAKNLPATPLTAQQRLCYRDEVYRFSRENREYKVVEQIGVELMGQLDSFCNVEIVDLALDSLALISEDFILDLSHNGFAHQLLKSTGLSRRLEQEVLSAIYNKSTHELEEALATAALSQENQEDIVTLATLSSELLSTLPKVKGLIKNSTMEKYYTELRDIADALENSPHKNRVRLDFSAMGDLDYYNGIVLLGYVKESPTQILAGGRYDKLLERMEKTGGALGFAISLSQLSLSKPRPAFDFDVLALYPSDVNPAALLKALKTLYADNLRVRPEPDTSQLSTLDFTYKDIYYFNETTQTLEPQKGGEKSC